MSKLIQRKMKQFTNKGRHQDTNPVPSNPRSTDLTIKQQSWFSWGAMAQSFVCTGSCWGRAWTTDGISRAKAHSPRGRDRGSPHHAVSCSPRKHLSSNGMVPISYVHLTDFLPRPPKPNYRTSLKANLHIKTHEIPGNSGGSSGFSFEWH